MIYVNHNSKQLEFHLCNQQVSYIFCVDSQIKILEHLYYGKKITHQADFYHLVEREIRPSNNLNFGSQLTSLEHIKQEIPVYGTTDFRNGSIEIIYPDGDAISHFEYVSYRIIKGKPRIDGLPHSFSNSKSETLEIKLKDKYSSLELLLYYCIFDEYSIITRWMKIVNPSNTIYKIEKALSFSLDFPERDFEWIHLSGAWAREAQLERDQVVTGVQTIESTRGASSHLHQPFMGLVRRETTEHSGEVYGFSLVYSGSFIGQIEVDSYDVVRVQLGIQPKTFSWVLNGHESFTTPEVIMCYSDNGLNGMSQQYHDFLCKHLIRQVQPFSQRPILINSWEASYFNFDEQSLYSLAQQSKEVGIDLFVLDDGWFASRNSDNGSLGCWCENKAKFPNGLKHFADSIHHLGMKFGIWIEPEMISRDVPLFRQHPDWIIGHPCKNISHGRNQYVLDFANPDVVEEIFIQLKNLLDSVPIDYIKWDMNRYISEAYSQYLSRESQGEVFHRYILGVYNLLEKILDYQEDLLIETCAGGGARFDLGMLYYSPQIWASDNTDAIERLKIQYGLSLVYPLSTIGSHVSAVPNHQVGRITSLQTRNDVALFGTFGYELNLMQLSRQDKQIISKQIIEAKERRKLIGEGRFYRLKSPFEFNETAWMVISPDEKEALIGYYQILGKANPPYKRLKLVGLIENEFYTIDGKGHYSGDELMNIGILLNGNYIDREQEFWNREVQGDFYSKLFYLKKL